MVEPEQRASQSRKWQLIGKSQWCCGAMQPIHCNARANGHWTRGYSQQAHHRPNQPHQAFTRSPDGATPNEVADIRLSGIGNIYNLSADHSNPAP